MCTHQLLEPQNTRGWSWQSWGETGIPASMVEDFTLSPRQPTGPLDRKPAQTHAIRPPTASRRVVHPAIKSAPMFKVGNIPKRDQTSGHKTNVNTSKITEITVFVFRPQWTPTKSITARQQENLQTLGRKPHSCKWSMGQRGSTSGRFF